MDDFYADGQLQRERNRNIAERNELIRHYEAQIAQIVGERDKANRDLRDVIGENGGNLALRYAFTVALTELDPSHALVRDPELRERIAKLGADTVHATNDWDQCREVWRTFKVPPSTLAVERDRLVRQYETVSGQNAGNLALRYSFAGALAKVSPDHPLVRDAALRDRIAKHGTDTIFKTHDWNQVREVGQTFNIPDAPGGG